MKVKEIRLILNYFWNISEKTKNSTQTFGRSPSERNVRRDDREFPFAWKMHLLHNIDCAQHTQAHYIAAEETYDLITCWTWLFACAACFFRRLEAETSLTEWKRGKWRIYGCEKTMFAVIFGVAIIERAESVFHLSTSAFSREIDFVSIFRLDISSLMITQIRRQIARRYAGDLNPDPCFASTNTRKRHRAHTLDDQLRVRFPSLSLISLAAQKKKSRNRLRRDYIAAADYGKPESIRGNVRSWWLNSLVQNI